MATHTPTKRSWVDVGSGVKVYAHEGTQNNIASTQEPMHTAARSEKSDLSTPKYSERESTGLATSPSSEEKNFRTISSQSLKASHSEYAYKLKVPDSKGRKLPRIVFRWYNVNSKGHNSPARFRAGIYETAGSTIPPPDSGMKLQDAFLSHLTPEKKLSPFISTFESFLPALNRALKSDKEAFIAMIDLQQVEKSLRRRFPGAPEVVWPIKLVIKQYGFKLTNHYKGHEWLIHGIIEKGDIIQTVKVSDLQIFARTGRIRHMRDVLHFISQQQHAFGLIDNLHIKPPKTSYRTGQLVGAVLDYLDIPDKYKAIVARKVKSMMKFQHYLSPRRDQAYRKGVYNFDHPDSDSDSDGMDDFLVDSDDEYNSDGTFWDDSDLDDLSRIKRNAAVRDAGRSTDESETDDSSESLENDADLDDPSREKTSTAVQDSGTSMDESEAEENSESHEDDVHLDVISRVKRKIAQRDSGMSTDESDDGSEQRLLDAQLHATEKEWIKTTSAPAQKMVRMSHVEVPKLTTEQRAAFKPVKKAAPPSTIDLTNDADNERDQDDDDDVVEVQLWTTEEDVVVVATAKRANKTMNLTIRSTSARSTIGPGGGIMRLEAEAAAADFEVMEVIQFD